MKERMRFIVDWERGHFTMIELCRRYGVSRKTGYKWIERFETAGIEGLAERSRAPHDCPHRIDAVVARAILDARRQHPSWGPRKAPGLARRTTTRARAASSQHGR
ncbi:MAG TPA: leucine zipper domain-containing protein [Candidatus Binatia bacterium]|nr:leucine zipper domain-containing protein [Candidatus Binatia bacterium]